MARGHIAQCLGGILARRGAATVAVDSGGRSFTGAEFADGVRRLAAGLAGRGVRPGDVVAVVAFNRYVRGAGAAGKAEYWVSLNHSCALSDTQHPVRRPVPRRHLRRSNHRSSQLPLGNYLLLLVQLIFSNLQFQQLLLN